MMEEKNGNKPEDGGPGLSPGAVAGIVVVVLLVATAAVGVFFYRRKCFSALTENVGNSEHETPLVYVEFADQEKGALTKEERKSEMEKDERERHIFVEDTAGSQAIGDDDEHP
ncbi:hypothetical protein ROHU_000813 [Labeo rohita]|uniref:Uncharacterized protein n=1 Tax=Labeo rohita TaxID=84645 RepID=A0A498P3Y8_LABRO|nr:hypothetical protein ROHU_000813 [Labeo rohita]